MGLELLVDQMLSNVKQIVTVRKFGSPSTLVDSKMMP